MSDTIEGVALVGRDDEGVTPHRKPNVTRIAARMTF